MFPLTFSGVPSFGGVGGKLKELDVALEVEGCTDNGAAGFGCVRDLLLKGFIHWWAAWGTIDLVSVNQGWSGAWKCGLQT